MEHVIVFAILVISLSLVYVGGSIEDLKETIQVSSRNRDQWMELNCQYTGMICDALDKRIK